jgi:mucolipin 3
LLVNETLFFQELPHDVIGKYTPHYSDWKSLPFSLKRKFASFWNLWNLVGNLLVVVSSILCFAIYSSDGIDLDMIYNLILGLGTFFSLINLTRYFELFRQFSVLINTLRVSFRRVIALLVSVMPVFFAFVLLGVAIFSNFSQVLIWCSLLFFKSKCI